MIGLYFGIVSLRWSQSLSVSNLNISVLIYNNQLAAKDPNIGHILKDRDLEITPNVSLAKKRCHGMQAVSSHVPFFYQSITVKFTALLFDQRSAALEGQLFVDDQEIMSSWSWFHLRIWNISEVLDSHSEKLLRLHQLGFADRIEINPPFDNLIGKTGILLSAFVITYLFAVSLNQTKHYHCNSFYIGHVSTRIFFFPAL